jgi:hypothetical protein
MSQKSRKTRREKIAVSKDKPAGSSRYAVKMAKRKKLAKKMDMPTDTPLPVLLNGEIVEQSSEPNVAEEYAADQEEDYKFVGTNPDCEADAFEAKMDAMTQAEISAEIAAIQEYNS